MSDFEEHLDQAIGPCVVAFSSRPERFEWGATLKRIGVNHVLMRDTSEKWYQQGLWGLGDPPHIIDYLNDLGAGTMLVALGLSSGSYAAMFFAAKCRNIDGVIAISPISGKGNSLKIDFEEKWWPRIEHGPEHPPVPDLRLFWEQSDLLPTRIKAFVSDGEGTELDRKMAERIGVTDITFIPGHSHAGLARHMRDAGIIAKLLGRGNATVTTDAGGAGGSWPIRSRR